MLTTYRLEPRIPSGRVIPARFAGIQHRQVAQTAIHGDWVPTIPAGTTVFKELIGGKIAVETRLPNSGRWKLPLVIARDVLKSSS